MDLMWTPRVTFGVTEAEASLPQAYQSGRRSSTRWSQQHWLGALILTHLEGGRRRDRMFLTDLADPVDVTNAGFFINSTFLFFHRRMNSVCDVLKGLKNYGYTEHRLAAFMD